MEATWQNSLWGLQRKKNPKGSDWAGLSLLVLALSGNLSGRLEVIAVHFYHALQDFPLGSFEEPDCLAGIHGRSGEVLEV